MKRVKLLWLLPALAVTVGIVFLRCAGIWDAAEEDVEPLAWNNVLELEEGLPELLKNDIRDTLRAYVDTLQRLIDDARGGARDAIVTSLEIFPEPGDRYNVADAIVNDTDFIITVIDEKNKGNDDNVRAVITYFIDTNDVINTVLLRNAQNTVDEIHDEIEQEASRRQQEIRNSIMASARQEVNMIENAVRESSQGLPEGTVKQLVCEAITAVFGQCDVENIVDSLICDGLKEEFHTNACDVSTIVDKLIYDEMDRQFGKHDIEEIVKDTVGEYARIIADAVVDADMEKIHTSAGAVWRLEQIDSAFGAFLDDMRMLNITFQLKLINGLPLGCNVYAVLFDESRLPVLADTNRMTHEQFRDAVDNGNYDSESAIYANLLRGTARGGGGFEILPDKTSFAKGAIPRGLITGAGSLYLRFFVDLDTGDLHKVPEMLNTIKSREEVIDLKLTFRVESTVDMGAIPGF